MDWWTFAGGRANACLAAALEEATGQTAAFDNFAVRLRLTSNLAAVVRGIEALRGIDPEEIRPRIDDHAIEGLKFSGCLPRERAKAMLETRLHDPPAIEAALSTVGRTGKA